MATRGPQVDDVQGGRQLVLDGVEEHCQAHAFGLTISPRGSTHMRTARVAETARSLNSTIEPNHVVPSSIIADRKWPQQVAHFVFVEERSYFV